MRSWVTKLRSPGVLLHPRSGHSSHHPGPVPCAIASPSPTLAPNSATKFWCFGCRGNKTIGEEVPPIPTRLPYNAQEQDNSGVVWSAEAAVANVWTLGQRSEAKWRPWMGLFGLFGCSIHFLPLPQWHYRCKAGALGESYRQRRWHRSHLCRWPAVSTLRR